MTQRLDLALVAAGQARSRSQAAELIKAGKVQVNGQVITRAAHPVTASDVLVTQTDPWVSRAAHKLLGALDASGIEIPARVLDAGASTGGFTQVLLSRGARQVYAVDVGHDQLDPIVRDDPRVVVREGLNLRDLVLADLDGVPVQLAVGDVSFISMTLVLPQLPALLAADGDLLLLIKPQFEVGPHHIGKGGIVRDPSLYREVEGRFLDLARQLGLTAKAWLDSPISGGDGNHEFFVFARRSA